MVEKIKEGEYGSKSEIKKAMSDITCGMITWFGSLGDIEERNDFALCLKHERIKVSQVEDIVVPLLLINSKQARDYGFSERFIFMLEEAESRGHSSLHLCPA
jgi:hypothetical protein